MKRALTAIKIVIAVGVLAWLVSRSRGAAGWDFGMLLVCFAAVVFTTTFGTAVGGGMVTLAPMVTVAVFLSAGVAPAVWVAFLGALTHGLLRVAFASRLGEPERSLEETARLTLTNIMMQSLGMLAGAGVYLLLGGILPVESLDAATLMVGVVVGTPYLLVNYLLAGLELAWMRDGRLQEYISSLGRTAGFEGLALIFAPLFAAVYARLGAPALLLMALTIVVFTMTNRNLAEQRNRLQRQVKERDSLLVVNRALTASLDLNRILETVYEQVSVLMRVENFYVALYDAAIDEVSFPFVIEAGQRISMLSRRAGQGLTEYVLRSRRPLLGRENTDILRRQLGLEKSHMPALSYLAAPILAGDQVLGVIAVQSYQTRGLYDDSHQEVLAAIASQAGVALQNARLYALTDQALAQRVLEMDSILRTVGEGVLLFDSQWRLRAINPRLADFLRFTRPPLIGESIFLQWVADDALLLDRLGYTPESLQAECDELSRNPSIYKIADIKVGGSPDRQLERTLALVQSRSEPGAAWLIVIRDVTEEHELARIRQDTLHMLVHDLRAPLAVLHGSLGMMKMALEDGELDGLPEMIKLAYQGSERMGRLVGQLLEIGRLEDEHLQLHPTWISLTDLFDEVIRQVQPAADESHIALERLETGELPEIFVDGEQLFRVIFNLLDNAIKFTPDQGRVVIWTRLEPDRKPMSVLTGVTDTGQGITEELRETLFAKFSRGKAVKSRRAGSGLGLHFCKLAVEAHGGQIWVESQPGRGSTFFIRLPVA